MFIYLFAIDGTNLLKIGLTDCLEKRIQSLNSFSGMPLALRPKIRGYFIDAWKFNVNLKKELKEIEAIIHNHFDTKRDRDDNGNKSEFFDVTYHELNTFIISTLGHLLDTTFNYKDYVASKEEARKVEEEISNDVPNKIRSEIMAVLKMPSTMVPKTWSVEELNPMKIHLNNKEDSSGSSILDNALKTLSVRNRSGQSERKLNSDEYLALNLTSIFYDLGKFKILKDYRISNDGKDKRVPHKKRPEGAADFNAWQKSGSPQRHEALVALGTEASWAIVSRWLKDKYETMYPLESPITGMEYVPNTTI